jgi:hypothetical protein
VTVALLGKITKSATVTVTVTVTVALLGKITKSATVTVTVTVTVAVAVTVQNFGK